MSNQNSPFTLTSLIAIAVLFIAALGVTQKTGMVAPSDVQQTIYGGQPPNSTHPR